MIASVSIAARDSFRCSRSSRASSQERSAAVRNVHLRGDAHEIDAAPGIERCSSRHDGGDIGALGQAGGDRRLVERLGGGEHHRLGDAQRLGIDLRRGAGRSNNCATSPIETSQRSRRLRRIVRRARAPRSARTLCPGATRACLRAPIRARPKTTRRAPCGASSDRRNSRSANDPSRSSRPRRRAAASAPRAPRRATRRRRRCNWTRASACFWRWRA